MLFHSQIFILLFLPITLVAYYSFYKYPRARQWLLALASMIFYAYWDIRFLPLLLLSILANYALYSLFWKKRRQELLSFGIILNLVILGIFKYANFFADSLIAVTGGTHHHWDIILPLGISFFTFQQLSYLVDLKNNKAEFLNLREYTFYVSFFPQLIAGPIVRHNEIIPQTHENLQKDVLVERASKGAVFFIIGIVKKAMIGDHVATFVNPLFAKAQSGLLSFMDAWIAAVSFSLQIYFDFSGYSDMAIGLGLMFGFILPINFDAPYKSTSIIEFWRRWHMTLSRFLRDYLYIPFGGNRKGFPRQLLNLCLTMLLGGLWHGASWTFIVWGGCHGAALSVNHVFNRTNLTVPKPIGWLLTFTFVVCTFVVFRAPDFGTAYNVIFSMFDLSNVTWALPKLKHLWLIPPATLISILLLTSQTYVFDKLKPGKVLAFTFSLVLTGLVVKLGGNFGSDFIYFQF